MKDETKKYLTDISVSINSIYEYLGEKRNFFEYLQNKLLRRGIERELEIIGEAMKRILQVEPEVVIQNSKRIVSTRNWVIHNYDKVDDVIVWAIINNDLPKLKTEIENLLSKTTERE